MGDEELSVVVDARRLGGALDGTRTHICELLAAVAQVDGLAVTALLPRALDAETEARVTGIARLRRAHVDAAGDAPAGLIADVVHRPHQIESPADLAFLAGLGSRLVLTQQDLISYHAAEYFADGAAWRGYRELTRLALVSADRVLFFSDHARSEVLAEEMVEPERAEVVRIGAASVGDSAAAEAGETPPALDGIDPAEMLLCLGTDLIHKNRPFALAVAASLARDHAWGGRLVLAGPHASLGSTAAEEAAVLAADPELARRVIDLGQVSDRQRAWLLEHAGLVLYPTAHEGFGLVPYEAVAHGVPCLWAAGTALAELLGPDAGQIVPGDAAATARAAVGLLRDPDARAANVAQIRDAAGRLSWADTGVGLAAAYRTAAAMPQSPGGALARRSALMNQTVSPTAMRLVGPDGLLPSESELPLLALLSRPALARPALALIGALYRLARRRRGGQ